MKMTDITYPNKSYAPLILPAILVLLWAGVITVMAQSGWFIQPSGELPVRLAIAFTMPPLLFAVAHSLFAPVRAWVTTLDLGIIVLAQSWRVIGIVFLFLWGLGDLPAAFALPAGLGDIAVGVFAIYVGRSVLHRTSGWQTQTRWLVGLGLLDFAIALSSAVLASEGRPLQLAGAPLPTMMQEFPMVLIPTFGVPLFAILHLIAWFRLRDLTRS
jgi:hypothetical protein